MKPITLTSILNPTLSAMMSVGLVATSLLAQEENTTDFKALASMGVTAGKLAPKLRSSTCMVCRDGSATIHAATLISKEGLILTSPIHGLGDNDLPYFIILNDGRRIATEIIHQNRSIGAIVLKVNLPPNSGLTPATMPAREHAIATKGSWHLFSAWDISPIVGATPRLNFARVIRAGDDYASRFTMDASLSFPGSPIFDLNGVLVGLITNTSSNRAISGCRPIAGYYEEWDTLADLAPKEKLATPHKPHDAGVIVTETDKAGESFRMKLSEACDQKLKSPSIIAILEDDSPIIYGTVISENGFILSKASELGSNLFCKIGEQTLPATLIATDKETDLAILSVKANNLTPIQWSDSTVSTGNWLYSPIPKRATQVDASSVGSLSHIAEVPRNHYSLHSPERVTSLGVVIEHSSNACKIAAVLPDGAAEEGEVLQYDIITHISGKATPDRKSLAAILARHYAGDKVKLTLRRGTKTITSEITLRASIPVGSPRGVKLAQEISTIPSIRAYGFSKAIVHDSALVYWQCGGPLLNIKGEAIGMNIASHSKGVTYALPVSAIRAAIKRMLAESNQF